MKRILLLAFVMLFSLNGFSQFNLLKDINQTEAGSNPKGFVEANDFIFFTVQTNDGYELWQSNGTETKKATEELLQGIGDYGENQLYVYSNELYFVANINQYERYRLMKTDGITVETVLENMPGVRLYFFNGKPHYLASSKLFKIENGTSVLVKQFTNSNTDQLQVPQVIDDKLIFFTKFRDDSSNSGYSLEIWVSDGTEIGTIKLKKVDNIISGLSSGSSYTYDKASVSTGSKCFFMLEKDTYYSGELWQTDGTVRGTFMVKDVGNFQLPSGPALVSQFRTYNGGVVFIHRDSELWFSDGTSAGTIRLLSIHLSATNQKNYWGELNGKLFFATFSAIDSKLWTTDGIVAGTVIVKDFAFPFFALPNQFYTYNNTLYFVANYNQLWQSDGTEAGTNFVVNIPKPNYSPIGERVTLQAIVSSDNKLYFTNYDAAIGHELWISEGTVASTKLLKNIATSTASSAGPTAPKLKVVNTLYFAATDGIHGNELWKTDGTTAGTQLVKDISPGSTGTRFVKLSSVNSTLYFSAYTSNDPATLKLFRSDGTTAGTVELPMNDGTTAVFEPDAFIPAGQKMYVKGRLPYTNGYSLWVINDPLTGNPVRLTPPSGSITSVSEYAVVGEKLYFKNSRLWVTAGTNETTKAVFPPSSSYAGHSPRNLIDFDGKAFYTTTFFGNSSIYTGIFSTDGTDIGTQKLYQFDNSITSFNEEFGLRGTDNKLYFATSSAYDSLDIWVSDGTVINTFFVKQLNSFGYYFTFKSIGDSLFIFRGTNFGRNDFDILITDGSADGTKRLLRLSNGTSLGSVDALGNKVYFNAYTTKNGYELWTSDASISGTYLIKDLRAGNKNTVTGDVIALNGKLIFWAIDSPLNVEPYTYTPEPCEANRNYTIKSGNWNDATTWSCGSVPTMIDYAIIKTGHSVVVPENYRAESKFLLTENGAVLDVSTGSVLKTGN